MNKKITFIGHRQINNMDIKNRLSNEIEKAIISGYKKFTMGTHGEFDKLALSLCREYRKKYKDIEIEVVLTSLSQIKPIIEKDEIFGTTTYIPFSDVKTVMYDIENEHFKNRIIKSNQQMIDDCEILICYVNPNLPHSGAKRTMNYAIKKRLKVINLFHEQDDIFYGLTENQKKSLFEKFIKK